MLGIDIRGFDETKAALMEAAKKYPDLAKSALEDTGRKFRNDVVKETYRAVEKRTGNLTKGYKLGKVERFGELMQVNFYAEGKRNPHFHLIENGHKLVTPKTRKGKKLKNGGKNIGTVPGRLIVGKVRKDYDGKLQKKIKDELDRLLKESGLC